MIRRPTLLQMWKTLKTMTSKTASLIISHSIPVNLMPASVTEEKPFPLELFRNSDWGVEETSYYSSSELRASESNLKAMQGLPLVMANDSDCMTGEASEEQLQLQQAVYILTVREELSRLNIPYKVGESENMFWHEDMLQEAPYESEDELRQVTARRASHRELMEQNHQMDIEEDEAEDESSFYPTIHRN